MEIFWYLFLTLISVALAPKPPKQSPPLLGQPEVPTADPSRKIPVLFGRGKITGSNVIYYGNARVQYVKENQKVHAFRSIKVLVARKLYLTMDIALCHGPIDQIDRIDFDGVNVWEGQRYGSLDVPDEFSLPAYQDSIRAGFTPGSRKDDNGGYWYPAGTIAPVTQNEIIIINAERAFGGSRDGNDGGVFGAVDIEFGGADQPVNDHLLRVIDGPVSAYRGITRLVFRDCYLVANSSYVKPVQVWGKNYLGATGFYPAKRIVGEDLNPAHIIYEAQTSINFGAGITAINEASFMVAADILYDEGFGLSFLWVNESSVEDFVQMVLDHINGVLYPDPQTGDLTLDLARNNYDINTLFAIDEDNLIKLNSREGTTPSEIVNEMTIIYTDYNDNDREVPITVQNISSISSQQGRIISETKRYLGVKEPELAYRIALRELRIKSASLRKASITINRTGWSLRKGQPIRLDLPGDAFDGVAVRIFEIDYGQLDKGEITIDVVEDVFGLPDSTYIVRESATWTPQSKAPIAVVDQRVIEAPYWDVASELETADFDALAAGAGFASVFADQPSGLSLGFEVWSSTINSVSQYDQVPDQEDATFTPAVKLFAAVEADANEVDFNVYSVGGQDESAIGTYAYIDEEIVVIVAIDAVAGIITVGRGALDTLPAAHGVDSVMYFSDENGFFDLTQRASSNQVYYRLLTKTNEGTLPIASAPAMSVVMNSRIDRPYPPGKIRINTEYNPSEVLNGIAMLWAHRDKLQQLDIISYDHLADSIGPEVGTTYTARIYNEAGALIVEDDTLTGTSFDFTLAQEYAADAKLNYQLRIVLFSVLGGLESWQAFDRVIPRAITPLWFASTAVNLTLSGGSRIATKDAPSAATVVYSTTRVLAAESGYCEITIDDLDGNDIAIGLGSNTGLASVQNVLQGGAITSTDGTAAGSGVAFTNGDVIGIAYNDGKVWFRHNGTWLNGGNPAADTGEQISGIASDQYVMFFAAADGNQPQVTANFGGAAFADAAPGGFAAQWNKP